MKSTTANEHQFAPEPETGEPITIGAVIHEMRRSGGSFATRLADAWLAADSENRARIEVAFDTLIGNYRRVLHYQGLAAQAKRLHDNASTVVA